jgi:hypothetical protein
MTVTIGQRELLAALGGASRVAARGERGGLTPAEAPLIDAEILFRRPQPPLCASRAA